MLNRSCERSVAPSVNLIGVVIGDKVNHVGDDHHFFILRPLGGVAGDGIAAINGSHVLLEVEGVRADITSNLCFPDTEQPLGSFASVFAFPAVGHTGDSFINLSAVFAHIIFAVFFEGIADGSGDKPSVFCEGASGCVGGDVPGAPEDSDLAIVWLAYVDT